MSTDYFFSAKVLILIFKLKCDISSFDFILSIPFLGPVLEIVFVLVKVSANNCIQNNLFHVWIFFYHYFSAAFKCDCYTLE